MRFLELVQDHEGQISSKRVLAFGSFVLAAIVVIRYLFTGSVDVSLVIALLSSSGAYIGVSAIDRRAKNKPPEEESEAP